MTAILVNCRPMESIFLNKVEIYNEITTISLLYLLYGFTNLIVNEEHRNELSPVYIGISSANIFFHLCI